MHTEYCTNGFDYQNFALSISLPLYSFGTYLCGKAQQEASDFKNMSQKHIDATIGANFVNDNTIQEYFIFAHFN